MADPGSFTIAIDPSTVVLDSAGTATAKLQLIRAGDFHGAVEIAFAGLPPGVAVDRTALAAGEDSASISFHSDGSAAARPSQVTATATSGRRTASANCVVGALSLSLGQSAVVLTQGQGASIPLRVMSPREVQITVRNLPAGVTADDLRIDAGSRTGVLQLHAGSAAPPATDVQAIVEAGAGTATASAALSVAVQPAEADALAVEVQPAAATLSQGGDASLTVIVQRSGIFRSQTLRVAASQMPAGVTADPAELPPRTDSAALILHAAADAPAMGLVPAELDVFAPCTDSCAPAAFTIFGIDVVSSAPGVPRILGFAPDAASVFVGERTRLTAVFDGDSASIDGLGAVESGVAIDTGPLAGTTSFTLRVRRGDDEVEAQTSVQANYRDRIRPLESAPFAQTNHVAFALPNGGAIVMGGNTSETLDLPDSTLSQVFDPATEKFARGPELRFTAETRLFTSAAALKGGAFMLAGAGLNGDLGPLRSVGTQLFDPAAGSFTRVGDVSTANLPDRTITPLADGGALLTGGEGPDVIPVKLADRYDAANGQWRTTGPMLHVREAHTATLLRDGRVLVAGGVSCCQTPGPSPEFFASTAEIYDPATGLFTATGSMAFGRALHAAVLLADGRVLITGGDGNDPAAPPLTAEIWDPGTGRFSPAGNLLQPRDTHAAVRLTDGRVLLIGGEVPPSVAGQAELGVPATEIYDPATGAFSRGPVLTPAFYGATVTLLASGKVLVFGGGDGGGFPQAAAAIFE